MKRPNPNFDSQKKNIEQWSADHADYRKATGQCSICDRKLINNNCPKGH